jgi:hypothetical protein
VNAVLKLRVPKKAGNFLNIYVIISFSRRTVLLGVSKFETVCSVNYSFKIFLTNPKNKSKRLQSFE